jgi:CheY-like chemotaxis protein
MQPQPLAINDLIANLAKMLKRLIREDILLECHYAKDLPYVQADAGMLEQVLLNLVVNARDAMPRGGKLDLQTEKLTVAAAHTPANLDARPGEFVCFSVSDTGVGIAPEHLPRIFEPFFTTKESDKGSGLGLATVYRVIKQHQGWVEVSSRVGRGTTFRVVLPVIPPPAKARTVAAPEAALRGGGETILLVEDDLPVRMITRRVLENGGYKVWEATCAREALELWSHHRNEIALLLTDLVMPEGVNGQTLAGQLRAQRPELEVIFMSGYSSEALVKEAGFLAKANGRLLRKPCPADTLLRTVRQCLDHARAIAAKPDGAA